MKIIKAPATLKIEGPSVFLAGSIEMGNAVDWQSSITDSIEESGLFCTVLNPRREDWDSSWLQSIEDPQFKQQVSWELNALEKAKVVAMYFAPGTKSPISLLELGLYAESGKMIVCCPHGFWRKGNVDVVCERYGIPVVETLEELADDIIAELEHYARY